MQAEFRAPRRRTRVQEDYQAPLPGRCILRDRTHFRAELINQHVLICDPDHIQKLYKQGYFGKGILSRSGPDHSLSDQWEEYRGLVLPLLSQSRYEQLLGWAESSLRSQGLDEAGVSEALLKLSEPMALEEAEPQGQCETERSGRPDSGDRDQDWDLDQDGDQDQDQDGDWDRDRDRDLDRDQDRDQDPQSTTHPGLGPYVPGAGLVLVESDSEAGLREVRRTPVSLSEYLQLGLEETFFLVYSLGCLSVYLQQEPLSVVELWRTFRSLRPDFVSSYAAYHHCRSRGWVPKGGGGAKYGVDFMLYRKGPPFYHASYSVVVQRTDGAFRGSALRPFSWRSLAALSRITANVSKELLLCYVVYPDHLSEAELDSPECLSKLTVQEVVVNRWVSSRERTEMDDI